MARAVTEPALAEIVLRLAVLLQAGVAPARAWGFLADAGDADAARVWAAVTDGMPLASAIRAAAPVTPRRSTTRSAERVGAASGHDPWRDVAAAWEVATAVGAPLADSLRSISLALRDAQEAADDVRVALAEPAATAKLMGWLPLVAVLLGVTLGFDTFGILLGNPIGIACLVLGIVLIVVAQRWNAALVKRARAGSGIPGLDAELLAIALSGGVSIERARRLVHDATGQGAVPTASARAAGASLGATGRVGPAATDAVLDLSRTAGVPAVELLRASAALARHRARVDGRVRAARLSSRLLLPLGICTLPAFLLLGVAPMLLSVMSSVPLPL